MMVVLMLFVHFGKFFDAYFFFSWLYLLFSQFKYFLCLNSIISIFYIFAILHHFFCIIFYPGLLIIQGIHSHITEQLLFGKISYFILLHLYIIFPNDLINDQCPF